jgi:hypothetical protein
MPSGANQQANRERSGAPNGRPAWPTTLALYLVLWVGGTLGAVLLVFAGTPARAVGIGLLVLALLVMAVVVPV